MGNSAEAAEAAGRLIGLDDFRGRWILERQIAGAPDAPVATFLGRAEFLPEHGGYRYREAGTLRIEGALPMRAERTYFWRGEADEIVVHFDDGRPFHRFAPQCRARGIRAEHLCGEDQYRVDYDFTDWPRWRTDWRVRGPRKDFHIVSRYNR